jgi:hypothetical protein
LQSQIIRELEQITFEDLAQDALSVDTIFPIGVSASN